MTTRLKLELIIGVIVAGLLIGGIAWHEKGVNAAREALAAEHKKETEALVQKLTADSDRKLTQVNQANAQQVALLAGQIGQLSNRMAQLSDRLLALQAAQAAQLAEIQHMTAPELISRLRVELGPAEGPLQPVPLTQKDLVKVDSWKVERDGCLAAAGVKDDQLKTCQEIGAKQDETIKTQAGSITLLNGVVANDKEVAAKQAAQCAEDIKAVKKPSRLKWALGGAGLVGLVKLIFEALI